MTTFSAIFIMDYPPRRLVLRLKSIQILGAYSVTVADLDSRELFALDPLPNCDDFDAVPFGNLLAGQELLHVFALLLLVLIDFASVW